MVNLSPTRDAALPFVTFYDDATGERTELSATSLRNWQAKTANYLRDGLGIGEGEIVELHLPPHWVVPIWVAAARAVGAQLRLAGIEYTDTPDVVVVSPDLVANPPAGHTVIACSLHPLALPFPQPPGPGIEDYFGEVRMYGDFFSNAVAADSHGADAVAERIAAWQLSAGDRFLLTATNGLQPDTLLALYDVPMAINGSLVVVQNSTAERIKAIYEQERVSVAITT